MGNKKKWLFNLLFLLVTVVLTYYAVLHEEDPRIVLSLLDIANGWYWLIGLLLVFLFVCCESLIIILLLQSVGSQPKPLHCLMYSFIGFFVSCITPAAGGGQPAQIYYMRKDGLNPGVTTPILVLVTVCYKLVLVLYGLAAAIIQPEELLYASDAALWWCLIGWLMNVAAVLFFLSFILKPELAAFLCRFILGLFRHYISEERFEILCSKIDRTAIIYHGASECIRNSPKIIFSVMVISIIQRTLLFAVTWVVLKSFYIEGYTFLTIVIMQSLVALGTDMLPLPGGSGANEALFLLLFDTICGDLRVTPVLLACRGISFYGQLIICGLVFFAFSHRLGKDRGK